MGPRRQWLTSLCDAEGDGTRKAVNEGGACQTVSLMASLCPTQSHLVCKTWDLLLNTDRPGGERPLTHPLEVVF